MNIDVSNLIAILEAELRAGENLRRNLDAQKQAIIAWDVEGLLAHVEAREVCLRGLNDLENRRIEVLSALPLNEVPGELSQLITQIPNKSVEHARLRDLQQRSRTTFIRLRTDEEALLALKKNLVGHIGEAMRSLAQQGASVYSESGHGATYGSVPGLLYEKA